MADVYKMGFEGMIYADTADGTTATTQLTNSRDISITTDHDYGDTSTRGAGTAAVINYQVVTGVTWSCDFQMLEKTDDTQLALLKAAAALGTPMAFRMKDHASGSGYDGDVNVSHKQGKPLKGEQTHDFTVTPCNDASTPRVANLFT